MKQKQEYYIEFTANYAEGRDAFAFKRKEDAIQSIREDAETEMESLSLEGYNPIWLEFSEDHIEIYVSDYVSDSGIYFEWKLVPVADLSDENLEELWALLGDVPMDPRTERMEFSFLHFPAGTEREAIWHWFDERYSKGVAALLYGTEE